MPAGNNYINKTHEQVKVSAHNRHYNYTENYCKQNNTQEKHSKCEMQFFYNNCE